MSVIFKEFHFCVLGSSSVGKTSLCERLIGKSFSRKTPYKQSVEDVATKYTIEIATSAGLLLFHFYDWAWEEKRKTESINQQLMRGHDGAIFMYDVNARQSKNDCLEHMDWFQRAAGFEKPCMIVSNKNDSKKKAVQDHEGQSLASKGDKRGYVAISLVEDSGVDDLVLMLSKLMLSDPNISMQSFRIASAESMAWSDEKALLKIADIGLSAIQVKSYTVILVVMNSAVIEKFNETFASSEYVIEAVANVDQCEEFIQSIPNTDILPLKCIIVPPTASESQQLRLKSIAEMNKIEFIVSIPKNGLTSLTSALAQK